MQSVMTSNSVSAGYSPGKASRRSALSKDADDGDIVRPKILIVEDEAILAEDLREILEQSGYSVCSIFSSGEDALAAFSDLRPDLVLMDIHLTGEMDGIQTAAQITSRFPVPIVFLTAFYDMDTIARATETNPYGYLVKPFVKETVHTTLQIALAKNRYDDQIRSFSDWLNITFRNLDRGILTIDRHGKIILMNSCAEMLTGWPLQSASGIPLDDVILFHDDILNQPYVPAISIVLSKGRNVAFPSDIRLIAKTGEMNRIKDCVLSPVLDTDGSILGAILVFTPVDDPDKPGLPCEAARHVRENSGNRTLAPVEAQKTQDLTLRIQDVSRVIHHDLSLERAMLYTILGKYDEAEYVYDRLLAEDPGNFQVWYQMGEFLTKAGRHGESLRAFDKALELNPDSGVARCRKADVLGILSMKKSRG